jgi:predicted Zn-dependent peptidase
VSGGWEEPPSYRGLFTVGGNTAKPAALVSAVQEVLEELLETAPSEEEIAQAKQGATNSFVFQFASRAQQLGRILVFDVLGLPPVRTAVSGVRM